MIGGTRSMSLIGRNIEEFSINSEITRSPETRFTAGACNFGVTKHLS